RGVRVFEYQAAILHAKTLVADDSVSLVGSTNLDFRSFHFNAECNLVILHGPAGRTFSAAFEEDLSHSVEITPALWSRRSIPHRLGTRWPGAWGRCSSSELSRSPLASPRVVCAIPSPYSAVIPSRLLSLSS
ncbi:MAG: phospholipase D-like domain-containing protein, partial [Thermoanaerobaculia bacterium]